MRTNTLTLFAAAALFATPAFAQENGTAETQPADSTPKVEVERKSAREQLLRQIDIQNVRPADQRGVNMFEQPKNDGVPFTGFKLDWGAAFTQQFQGLEHENSAISVVPTTTPATTTNQNALKEIGNGFNNAVANLNLHAQLANGIRVGLTTYLSSRHHQETWVKDGYLLIDASPIDWQPLHDLMKYVTVRAGHFEINYGDGHFRRTDNGNAMYNPLVGNPILDAFTTQIGGELYFRNNWGLIAMVAGTGGEIKGSITSPGNRSMAVYSKLGFDRQFTKDLRVRLTGSTFNQPSAESGTLYSGDRAGSRYYYVLENTAATTNAQFTSGLLNPGFNDKIRAYMINPFIKYRGLEFFGLVEETKGRGQTDTKYRDASQQLLETVFRFGPAEQLYVAGRWNKADADMSFTRPLSNVGPRLVVNQNASIDRTQFGGGWFITPGVLLKGEYVIQNYNDFPVFDIRNGGKFDGFVIEGVVAF